MKTIIRKAKGKITPTFEFPPVDTVHQFSDKHLDQEFIDHSFSVLSKHNLKPLTPLSWYRQCWHSNYGYCLDEKKKTVFVKIFKPQLINNFQMEISARTTIDKIGQTNLLVPKIHFSFPDDLCLVMEPVTGISLSGCLTNEPKREKLLELLVSILTGIHHATEMRTNMSVNDWILTKSQQYLSFIEPYQETLEEFPRFKETSSLLKWINTDSFAFALGDVTPTHIYWNEDDITLSILDLELAGTKPEYYDLAYFCHRLITRFPHINSKTMLSIVMSLFSKVEEAVNPENLTTIRNNLISLLGIRMLGGLVDCLAIEDGTKPIQHLKAWKLYLEIRTSKLGID